MDIDRNATRQAPEGWEILRTTNRWQAMHLDCKARDDGLHGPMRKSPDEAIADAARLDAARPTPGGAK